MAMISLQIGGGKVTDEEIVCMLKKIKSYYQNFALNNDVAEAWIDIFKDYEKEPIMASLVKYVKTNEYSPVPASILKIYDEGKAKLNKYITSDYETMMGILTFMLQKSDVASEVDYYRKWISNIPEISRKQVSCRVIENLKQYGNSHIGEKFDFKEWLNLQQKGW